jgi:hypothetical protein
VDTYWFDLEVGGPVTDDHIAALGDLLAAAGEIDAIVQAGQHGGTVTFSRRADDAMQALVTAIEHAEDAGMDVTGVTEDRVLASEIAERAGVTPTTVRYWITGERGRGGFPAPKVRRQRASLYSWAEVSAWLETAKLGEVDHAAAETAQACALVNAALTVRRGMRDLPAHDRPFLARLVA